MNTDEAIQKLSKQLRLSGKAYGTIKAYCCGAGLFFKKFGDEIPSKSAIEDFLLEFDCLTYRKHILVALKHLNKIIYNSQLDIESIPYPEIESRLPDQYSAKSIQEFLKTYAKKAGIKKNVHPHQIRHSFLTELFNSGVQESLIQRIAGHQRRSTTMRYVHLSNTHISNVQSPISQLRI